MLNIREDDDVTSPQPREKKFLKSSWEKSTRKLNELDDGEGKAEPSQ